MYENNLIQWEDELKDLLEYDCDAYLAIEESIKVNLFIKSLLKEQREICAKTQVDYASHNVDRCENCQEVMKSIINASEPTGTQDKLTQT